MMNRKRFSLFLAFVAAVLIAAPRIASAESACVKCHRKVTPNIVKDFLSGAMGKSGEVDCADCHGSAHKSKVDVDKVELPTEKTCQKCHEEQHDQYMAGKHSAAWIAMSAMPTNAIQPHPYIQGLKGCGGCHKVGIRDSAAKGKGYGSPCDSCHTRHKFSKAEASRPEACRTCHMGFDHPQWEMWSGSKHGVIYQTEGDTGRAPKCQTCHMEDGNHNVMTSWGFLAVRLPEDDQEWMGYRATILKALHVLDPDGKPTARLDVVKAGKVARLDKESWQKERDRMIKVCSRCHSEKYARTNLQNADMMIREADKLMAEAIEIVADLYRKGIIKAQEGKPAYPDVLTFYDAMTPIEQTLYVMFLEHRMRAFQGAFHMNPDYVTWYGLAEMKKDLVEIRAEAERMEREAARK